MTIAADEGTVMRPSAGLVAGGTVVLTLVEGMLDLMVEVASERWWFVVGVNPQSEEMETMLAVEQHIVASNTERRWRRCTYRDQESGGAGRERLAVVDLHITSNHSNFSLC